MKVSEPRPSGAPSGATLNPKPYTDLQDADSLDKAGKKAEGAYYVWAAQEIDEVLGADTERGRAFKQHYYVKAGGNVDLSPRRYARKRARPVHMKQFGRIHR